MIKQLLEEVRASSLDEASRVRLKEIHTRSIKELEEGLAPELVDELERISLPFTDDSVPVRGRAAGRAGAAGRLARGPVPRHPDRAVRPADGGPRAVRGDAPPGAARRARRIPGGPGGRGAAGTAPPPTPASTSSFPVIHTGSVTSGVTDPVWIMVSGSLWMTGMRASTVPAGFCRGRRRRSLVRGPRDRCRAGRVRSALPDRPSTDPGGMVAAARAWRRVPHHWHVDAPAATARRAAVRRGRRRRQPCLRGRRLVEDSWARPHHRHGLTGAPSGVHAARLGPAEHAALPSARRCRHPRHASRTICPGRGVGPPPAARRWTPFSAAASSGGWSRSTSSLKSLRRPRQPDHVSHAGL